MFGSTVVAGKEAKVSNIKVSYLHDGGFFEFLCLIGLPRSGEAFLKSLMCAPLGGEPFPCLPAEASGFFGLGFFGLGLFFCWFGFFSADLSGVAGGCFFVDGARFWLFIAPRDLFFGGLSA